MTPFRKTAALVCAAAAIAAVGGAVFMRRMQAAAVTAAVEKDATEAKRVLQTVETAIDGLKRGLEIEVKGAAAIPQLQAALGDGVDAATILDLFDSEDWWAPFRARGAALVTGSRVLAARSDKGEKKLPLPEPKMLERAQTAGVASGVLVGDAAIIAAVVPVGTNKKDETTFLMLAQPLDASELSKTTGIALLLSDGARAVSAAGTTAQQATMARLVGKESAGSARDPDGGWTALPASLAPKLWLWAMHTSNRTASADNLPTMLAVGAIVLGLAALLLWRMGGRASGRPSGELGAVPNVQVMGSPRLGATVQERPRRGTKPYQTGSQGPPSPFASSPDIGHRPTEVATTGSLPASGTAGGWGGGEAMGGRAALAEAFPERARVDTGASTFGRYRLLERLGEGGMAEIYTAVLHGAEGFRRLFVVKRLRPHIARNRSAVEQFIDEAKMGSSLVHSNIVPVFDFGKVNDEYFLAQEYIIGRDLGRLIERHVERTGRPLSERVTLYIVHEVLEALAYAHTRTDPSGNPLGLVHRDISPGNIMLTSRGEVKLFDFGIVKAEGRVSRTDVGVVKGNVSFMSPEQARGMAVDGRSDLFSLGLVMYYALTHEQLYPGESTFDQLMKAATGPKTEHLRRLTELPPVSTALLARALVTDPVSRYQSAAEFAAAIAPQIAGAKSEAAALMQQLFGEEFKRENAF
jgi:hypothetical protein